MKKLRATRIASFMLVLALLLSPASAANEIQPRYQKISIMSAELFGVSWLGKVTCVGSVSLWDTSCTARLTVDLQRSTDCSSWETIKTGSASGDYDLIIEEDWYVTSGYYYQVVAGVTVFNSSGAYVEMDAAESAIIQY